MARIALVVLVVSLAAHFCHVRAVWVDEAYSMAAAQRVAAGEVLYRDIWFDKPPLYAWICLAWGAAPGWPLRVAGAVFVALNCWLAGMAAGRLFGEREARAAALLLGFFLTFGFAAAVLPLAPDMLTIPFALAFVWLAAARRPFWAGMAAGAALLANAKALFLLPVALLWVGQDWPLALAGYLCAPAGGAILLAAQGALGAHWQQVWKWGFEYSRDTFLRNPLQEGLRRTGNWLGFHAALAVPAAVYWWRERDRRAGLMAIWLIAAMASVAAGWRFFPRYYLVPTPVLALAAARGIALIKARTRLVLLTLALALPAARFGPAYFTAARDAIAGTHRISDLAMYEDSLAAARLLQTLARPGDTLLVWGYRPELNVLARMPAASRFLDSQPLTGVLADRHLTRSDATFPALAEKNRRELARTKPTFVVDGLGVYNPALAIGRFPDLAEWFRQYRLVGRTEGCLIYERRG